MLDKLDSILSGIVEFPDADVLDFKTHGISICGMPEFRSGGEDVLNGHNQLSHVHTGGSSPEEWSSTEEIIRSVLSHVSKTPEGDIHPDMTIFRLGLDSISAIKVSSLLRKRSITLTVSEMLQAATIRNMARIVEEQPQNETSLIVDTEAVLAKALEGLDTTEILRSSGVDMANLEQVLPASAGQTYMLSVWQNSQGALFYPVFDYRLQGFLDEESLEKAWRALVAELPILRTTFVTTGNNTIPLLQVVFKHVDNPVVWLPPSDTTEKTDFRSPPVTLYAQRTATETHLKLHIHHALYDGVSLPGIVRRLEEHYNHSKSQGVIRPSFADFLALELSSSADRQRKNFWSGYLAKTKAPLPLTPITESLRRVEIFRPRILGDAYRLETFAGRQGCSVQMLFLAAFAKVYATIQKAMHSTDLAHDTVFGVYLANRSHHLEGLAKLAAPTLNLVPLRIKAPLTLPTIEIAQNIQHDLQIISHIENCGAALWEIENWTGIKIDCFVNFLKLPDHDEERNHTEGHSDKVVIEAIKSERDDGLYRLGVPEYNDHVETGPLANNLVKDAYLVRCICVSPSLLVC